MLSRLADLVVPARLGPGFRWLLASSWVTNLGDGITLSAGPLLVASQTHNPLAVASAAFLQQLPWLMFGLYAGVVADRVSRRAIVITTGLVRAVILLLLTASILTRHVDIAVVLAALFLFGVNETVGATTSATLLPMLVDRRDLGLANSRGLAGVIVWNQLAGPPIGAALFAVGIALPFVCETVCVLAGVLLIARVQLPAHPGPPARPGCARTSWRGVAERHVPLGVIMRGGLIIETLTDLALALTRWVWFALIVFAIFGAHAFIWGTTSTSVRQRAVPAEFQARVSSVYLTGVVGGIAIGSAIGGLVASVWGVTAPFWFAFVGSAIILAFIWRSLLQIAHADENPSASPT